MTDLAWLDTVGIYGAGFMGSGIAESSARAGLDVILYEPEQAALDLSRERIETSLVRAVKGDKLTREEADLLIGRMSFSTDLEDLSPAQMVLEAIAEEVEVKHEAFSRMDAALPEARFIASNTSSIPIARLASATSHPERVLGLHFFSPVPVMKLVEIVVALDTSQETVESARAFAMQIGKRPIETRDRSWFIVNMLLVPYLMAACACTRRGSPAPRT